MKLAISAFESESFEEAANEEIGKKTMLEKIVTIEKNHLWDLFELPKGKDCNRA